MILNFCGAFGGLAMRLLDLAELYKLPPERRPDVRDPLYWIQFFVFPLVGGVTTFAYAQSGTELNAILAVNIGASAPLILRSLRNVAPALGPHGPTD